MSALLSRSNYVPIYLHDRQPALTHAYHFFLIRLRKPAYLVEYGFTIHLLMLQGENLVSPPRHR